MGACDMDWIASKRSFNLSHEPPHPKRLKTETDVRDEKLTRYADEEEERLDEEIRQNEGFDIDFWKYRYTYGILPVEFDDDDQLFVKEPDTDRGFLGRLSMEALDRYNEENGTALQFGKFVKANWGGALGIVFFITIEVTDPSSSDNQPLLYQVKVRHFSDIETEFVFCRPRPCQED